MIEVRSIEYPLFVVWLSHKHIVRFFQAEDGIHVTDSLGKNWTVKDENITVNRLLIWLRT